MTSSLEGKAPKEIVYIPEGSHSITPSVNGKPSQITVNVPKERGVEIAARLQASLTDRLGGSVRPHIDFDHKHSGPAAAIPSAFSYKPGLGIVLALDWSGSGKTAVESKDYSYFSPEFLIADDGTPHSLPSKGPIGSLVNEPAFREIPRIAAADAAPPNDTTDMNPLVQCGLLTDKEAALPEAIVAATQRVSVYRENAQPNLDLIKAKDAEIEDLKTKNKALEDEKVAAANADAAAKKSRAETLVAAACTDGRIAPKDEATKEKYLTRIAAGDTFAEEILGGLPKKFDPTGKVVEAKSSESKKDDDEPTGLDRVAAALAAENAAAN